MSVSSPLSVAASSSTTALGCATGSGTLTSAVESWADHLAKDSLVRSLLLAWMRWKRVFEIS